MNDETRQQLMELLGKRYDLKVGTEKTLVMYRRAKTEFKETRLTLQEGTSGALIAELQVDIRIPKGFEQQDAEKILRTFESRTASPRGFTRVSDETNEMLAQNGASSGWARSLLYSAEMTDHVTTAKHIRALVENLDIPIILGIHEDEDVYAKDARPLPKPKSEVRDPRMPLEKWRFRVNSSLLKDLSIIVDPNERLLSVTERKGVTTKELCEPVRLAHIAKFTITKQSGGHGLVATKRDQSELTLIENSTSPSFVEVISRMSEKVRIPLYESN